MDQGTADFIGKLGFPIAVAVYVLVRLNGKFDRLTEAINSLSRRIEYIAGKEEGR